MNGTAGVGKDTFVNFCITHLRLAHGLSGIKFSSVDKVKEAAWILGWDGIKDEKGRKFLSDLKDLSTEAYDAPLHYLIWQINDNNADMFFIFMREPEEITRFAKDTGAATILIERGEAAFNNHADQNIKNYDYDFYINNGASLRDLRVKANNFVNEMVK